MGITESDVANHLFAARESIRSSIREEIRDTVRDPETLEEEWAGLFVSGAARGS